MYNDFKTNHYMYFLYSKIIIIFELYKHHCIDFISIITNMSIINKWYKLTDVAIVEKIGKMIQEVRLQRNYSQSELARISGVSRATISQLENGRPATLLTFVQVLRALNKFDVLNNMVQEPEISPILYAKLQGKKRKRASRKSSTNNKTGESTW